MSSVNSKASWIGKAAWEIMQIRNWNGRQANAYARHLANDLLDYGIDLARIDARDYVRTHSPLRRVPRSSGTSSHQPETEREKRKNDWLNIG